MSTVGIKCWQDQSKHSALSSPMGKDSGACFLGPRFFPLCLDLGRGMPLLALAPPPSFLPLIPGKGTARKELPFHPTHSCGQEALAGTKLSQEQESRRRCSLLSALARPLLGELHPHATCSVHWHWLPGRTQRVLSAPGGDPRSRGKVCLKGKSEKMLDCTL